MKDLIPGWIRWDLDTVPLAIGWRQPWTGPQEAWEDRGMWLATREVVS
jgi:hypothetical protein